MLSNPLRAFCMVLLIQVGAKGLRMNGCVWPARRCTRQCDPVCLNSSLYAWGQLVLHTDCEAPHKESQDNCLKKRPLCVVGLQTVEFSAEFKREKTTKAPRAEALGASVADPAGILAEQGQRSLRRAVCLGKYCGAALHEDLHSSHVRCLLGKIHIADAAV